MVAVLVRVAVMRVGVRVRMRVSGRFGRLVSVLVLYDSLLDTLHAVLSPLQPLVNRGRPASCASRQFQRMRQNLEQALEVLLGCLWTARESDNDGAGPVA